MVHEQRVVLVVEYNPSDQSIDVRSVYTGEHDGQLIGVPPEPPGSLTPEERFWPVLRVGNKRFVLCEIDATD